MPNSEEIINTQSFFAQASNDEIRTLLNNFTLDPEGKDKKGLEHIFYGDSNGGAHMEFSDQNLENKRQEIKEFCSKIDKQKGKKKYLKETFEKKLNGLNKDSPTYVENKEKLEKDYQIGVEAAEAENRQKIQEMINNKIKDMEKVRKGIIDKKKNEQKDPHNSFPLEWGPSEIRDVITDILKDKNSTITEAPAPEMGKEEKGVRSSGSREKRVHGPSWEVKGKYNGIHIGNYHEISMIVIIAKDFDNQAMKLISAYPENKLEKQHDLPRTLGLFQ